MRKTALARQGPRSLRRATFSRHDRPGEVADQLNQRPLSSMKPATKMCAATDTHTSVESTHANAK